MLNLKKKKKLIIKLKKQNLHLKIWIYYIISSKLCIHTYISFVRNNNKTKATIKYHIKANKKFAKRL